MKRMKLYSLAIVIGLAVPIGWSSIEQGRIKADEQEIHLTSIGEQVLKEGEPSQLELKLNQELDESVYLTGEPTIAWNIEKMVELNSDYEFSMKENRLSINRTEEIPEGSKENVILEGTFKESGQVKIVGESSKGGTTELLLNVEALEDQTEEPVLEPLQKPLLDSIVSNQIETSTNKTSEVNQIMSSKDKIRATEPVPINLVNGSFEQPVIQGGGNNGFFTDDQVPGWKTTATDKKIELQNSLMSKPFNGNQYAELNANQKSALYQDIKTKPGATVKWSVAHKARSEVSNNGFDIANVKFGQPNSDLSLIQTMKSEVNRGWTEYSGFYKIPQGQTITRFQFEAVSTSTGALTVGNLLDSVVFTSEFTSSEVHVDYVDEKGEKLSASDILYGDNGSSYTAKPKEIPGYEVKEIVGEATGTFTEANKNVKFVYQKKMGAPVTIKYQDEFGVKLSEDKVITGRLDTEYQETPIEVANYKHIRTDGNATGTFGESPGTVKFIYKKNEGIVLVKYQDESGKTLSPDKTITDVIGSSYNEAPVEIDGYKHLRTTGSPTGTIGETPVTIIFVYNEHRFDLTQEVSKLDGSSAELVHLGETLRYKVNVKSLLKDVTPTIYYRDFTINEAIDVSLEKVTEIKLTKTNGNVVGTASYNPITHTISGNIKENAQVKRSENLFLTYHATVKQDVPFDTLIKEKATAGGSYTDGTNASEKQSNEVVSKVVVGDLIFTSAPKTLDFGNPAKISAQEKNYYLNVKDGNLSVEDFRGIGKKWSMTAKMIQPLTHDKGARLSEAMYYQYKGNEQLIGIDESALIWDETTTATDVVTISDTWTSEENQPFVKVLGGQAKVGNYRGIIQWSLQDVPSGRME